MIFINLQMAFYLTINGIGDKCIKHIYSGSPRNALFRSHTEDLPSMQHGYYHVTAEQKFNVSQRTFFSQYKTTLPRAPAYRILPKKKINEIVARLYLPPRRSGTYTSRLTASDTTPNHKLLMRRENSVRSSYPSSNHRTDTVSTEL